MIQKSPSSKLKGVALNLNILVKILKAELTSRRETAAIREIEKKELRTNEKEIKTERK